MSDKQKIVLITGIDGFTGYYVAEEMTRAGYQVIGCSQNPASEYIHVDLTKPETIDAAIKLVQPNLVIHLAAISFVAHSTASEFYKVNTVGTYNLLQSIYQFGRDKIESVLLVSSANIYGNAQSGRLSENTIANPVNDYAVSKLAAEYIAKLWMDKLPIVITRPFNYTGVGQRTSFLVPKIVSHFKDKLDTIELGNIDVWRDFSDVRSVAYVYRRLLEHNIHSQIVNICSGHTYSLREIIEICQTVSNFSINININPQFVRANEVKELSGDNSLLHSLIGDSATIPLEDTLAWMLKTTVN